MGKSIDFEKFSKRLSELEGIEHTLTEEEKRERKDAELSFEILREWEDTSKVADYKPEDFARIINGFVGRVNENAFTLCGYQSMFNAASEAKRISRKKRIL